MKKYMLRLYMYYHFESMLKQLVIKSILYKRCSLYFVRHFTKMITGIITIIYRELPLAICIIFIWYSLIVFLILKKNKWLKTKKPPEMYYFLIAWRKLLKSWICLCDRFYFTKSTDISLSCDVQKEQNQGVWCVCLLLWR